MGVKGLFTFFLENLQFFKSYKLHDSHVVIDGDNLVYPLYFDHKINVICGGDYNKYAESVRKYFNVFLECNVKPIVVFDGGIDKSGRKLKITFDRLKERLLSVKKITQNKRHNKQILPILAHEVFISVLKELDISFVICDYEADDQICSLANYYKCPVISTDSDFFIFDVHNGFIPRDSIEKSVDFDIDSNGKEYKYLDCHIYSVDDFVSHFPGIQKKVLPLFGTLIGNDYVENGEFEIFFSIQLPKPGRKLALLHWLRNKSLSDAMNQVLQCWDAKRRDYVKSIIEIAVSSYDLRNCNLLHSINQKSCDSDSKFLSESQLITPCGNSLPSDFIIKYHSGDYSAFFPNIIVLHKHFLVPQIDDFSASSSYTCARYIRRVIYGILIRHDVGGDTCANEKCLAPIEEYDRYEDRLEKDLVKPITFLEDIGILPKINELSNLGKEKAKLILMKVLGINLEFIANLPSEWQLIIGSTYYWFCNSFPSSTEAFLHALIINLIYCDIIEYDNPYQYTSESCNESTDVHHTCSFIPCILSTISKSELQFASKNLKKYLPKPYIRPDNLLCLEILHSYSQLQSCVIGAVWLNKLLGVCIPNPDIAKCLNGSLLYNLTKDISTKSDPKSFVAKIFGSNTTLFILFTLLHSTISYGVPSQCIKK